MLHETLSRCSLSLEEPYSVVIQVCIQRILHLWNSMNNIVRLNPSSKSTQASEGLMNSYSTSITTLVISIKNSANYCISIYYICITSITVFPLVIRDIQSITVKVYSYSLITMMITILSLDDIRVDKFSLFSFNTWIRFNQSSNVF